MGENLLQARQDLFRQKADRLYPWTGDPAIPAENNRAERALRPLVITRKVSFGSQSEAGARTREILMTVLQTLALRTADPPSALKSCLDHLALHPDAPSWADQVMLTLPRCNIPPGDRVMLTLGPLRIFPGPRGAWLRTRRRPKRVAGARAALAPLPGRTARATRYFSVVVRRMSKEIEEAINKAA